MEIARGLRERTKSAIRHELHEAALRLAKEDALLYGDYIRMRLFVDLVFPDLGVGGPVAQSPWTAHTQLNCGHPTMRPQQQMTDAAAGRGLS